VLATSASAATSFTWSGADSTGVIDWSGTTNWVGAVAPSGSVGTLTFPGLTAAACPPNPPAAACYQSNNDLPGISAAAIAIDDGNHTGGLGSSAGYDVTGNGITLGSGGIAAAPDPADVGFGGASISLPITLGASQTWTVAGGALDQQLALSGSIAGAASTLGITFSNNGYLELDGDTEVGAITASGQGTLVDGSAVNGSDGNPVNLTAGAELLVPNAGATSGPLTTTGAQIQVGEGGGPDGTLAVNGGVTLDAASTMTFFVDRAGTTPGTDFSQLTASGNVALGGASLAVLNNTSHCPKLVPGDVLVLLQTTGTLSGTFGNAADGALLPLDLPCGGAVKIHYTSNSVTATVPRVAPPQQGQSANVGLVSGTVLVNGVPLTYETHIHFGSVIDTRHGVIAITTKVGHKTEVVEVSQGVFRLTQAKKTGLTTATLVENRSVCRTLHTASRKGAVLTRSRKRLGKLRVKGKRRHRLHFVSAGGWGSAGVGDPDWLVADRCDGTYIHVYQGAVTVRDFALHRRLTLRAGKSYVARSR
jgi:hypothetical protein